MMLLQRICLTICVLSALAGVVLAIMLVWSDPILDTELILRGLLTAMIVFIGSGAVLAAVQTTQRRPPKD